MVIKQLSRSFLVLTIDQLPNWTLVPSWSCSARHHEVGPELPHLRAGAAQAVCGLWDVSTYFATGCWIEEHTGDGMFGRHGHRLTLRQLDHSTVSPLQCNRKRNPSNYPHFISHGSSGFLTKNRKVRKSPERLSSFWLAYATDALWESQRHGGPLDGQRACILWTWFFQVVTWGSAAKKISCSQKAFF